MTTLPLVLLLTAAVSLGGYNLVMWLRRTRKPILIGVHLLLGVGAAETLIVFVHNSDLAEGSLPRRLALTAAAFLAAAIFTGFSAPLVGKNFRVANSLVAAHVVCGAAGFLIALAFVSQL